GLGRLDPLHHGPVVVVPGRVGVGPLDETFDGHLRGASGRRRGHGAGLGSTGWSWRSLNRCNLPVDVLGSSVTNTTRRGYLYGAMRSLTWSCSSLTFASSPVTPSRSTTKAVTTWPRASSGSPTTPHSATSGWDSSASSTSGPAML